jgi:hypothetical protein
MEKNARASIGNMVRYEDPVTGEHLYRPRKTEDGVLPGDRFEYDIDVGGDDTRPSQAVEMLVRMQSLIGRRARVIIEVLE